MQSNDIRQVITRKAVIAELAKCDVHTLEQLAALTVEDLQSIAGIGEEIAPRIQASAQAYIEDKSVWFDSVPESIRSVGRQSELDRNCHPEKISNHVGL